MMMVKIVICKKCRCKVLYSANIELKQETTLKINKTSSCELQDKNTEWKHADVFIHQEESPVETQSEDER